MEFAFPFSPSPKNLNFLLQQQQQSESQRAVAAAAMLLGGGEDLHKYSVRSPRMDRGDLITNPSARQIYLTSHLCNCILHVLDLTNRCCNLLGPRVLYGNMVSHEAFLRRKLEEQQQTAELQQAIELQDRGFMALQLLDLKSRGHHLSLSAPVGSHVALGLADGNGSVNGNGSAIHLEDANIQDNKLNTGGLAMSTAAASAAISAIAAQGKQEQEGEGNGNGSPKQAVDSGEEGERDERTR